MIEKPLIIIIFLYATSFGLLGAQYVLGDVFGVTLVSPTTGAVIQSNILEDIIDTGELNTRTTNIVNANQTTITDDPITAAAELTIEIFLLLTGTYVFNIIYLLGVPAIVVAGMVILYFILLARTIIALLRGI